MTTIHDTATELAILVPDNRQYRAFMDAPRQPRSYQILLVNGDIAPDMHGTVIVASRDDMEDALRDGGHLDDAYYVISPADEHGERHVGVCTALNEVQPFGRLVHVVDGRLWGEPFFVDPIPQYTDPLLPWFYAIGIWHPADLAHLSLLPRYRGEVAA